MIKFGSDNVIVGYIKQLLSSFNLPLIDVYKPGKLLSPGSRYIYNTKIYEALDANTLSSKPILSYNYNSKIVNLTTTFNNTSLVYDFETHKYLGKYLRFLRDYKNINLMSLYNYFSNEYLSSFDFVRKSENTNVEVSVEESDNRYKYYRVPIVAGSDYTIAITSKLALEVCCVFYSKSYNQSTDNFLENMTYQKINPCLFNNPIIYDKLNNDNFISKLDNNFLEYNNLKDTLCMILKVPVDCNSSIVILEGDHRNDNDYTVREGIVKRNYSITNYEGTSESQLLDITLKSRSQLLYINSNVSYPFADKLLGYLLGNTISNLTEISNDIKRMQKKLVDIQENSPNANLLKNKNLDLPYGIWKNKYRNILYDYYRKSTSATLNQGNDILGYCDKDVEKSLTLFKVDGKDIKV